VLGVLLVQCPVGADRLVADRGTVDGALPPAGLGAPDDQSHRPAGSFPGLEDQELLVAFGAAGFWRPRDGRALTVPSATPSIAAISATEQPPMGCSTTAHRCFPGIARNASTGSADTASGAGTSGGGPCRPKLRSMLRALRQRLTADR